MRRKSYLRGRLDLVAAEQKLWDYVRSVRSKQSCKRGNSLELKVEQAMKILSFAKGQLRRGFLVRLPDYLLAQRLRVKKARIKELKRFLREAGVMFVPPGMRPRASWHAGKWLFHKSVLEFYDITDEGVADPVRSRCSPRVRKLRWNPLYYKFRQLAVVLVRLEFRKRREDGSAWPGVRERMVRINQVVWEIATSFGYLLSDLGWNPPPAQQKYVSVLAPVGSFVKIRSASPSDGLGLAA